MGEVDPEALYRRIPARAVTDWIIYYTAKALLQKGDDGDDSRSTKLPDWI